MEQATNQFNKGLQMDTHPMVQSNDSLTDCLNGTLITMNGNEVILQNDMGNRRVNNAFLPAGYQPIGIKEYGGIIYIAAYNPITNKSQIGSFPSPQKKFNNIEDLESLDFQKFFDSENIFSENFYIYDNNDKLLLNFVKSDTQLVLLTKDSSIYPGDKFTVYCPTIAELKDNLTNYNNIENDEIYSPKNKDYTLSLGVLNSQNEFMDITPSLQRWDTESDKATIINFKEKYDYEVSENFKFNSGYFIPKSFDNSELEETQNDANFIRARQAFPINTYSSKLIGPLCLKLQFNHVENFDYDISGYKDECGNVYLTIEGFFTYNCQDVSNDQFWNFKSWDKKQFSTTGISIDCQSSNNNSGNNSGNEQSGEQNTQPSGESTQDYSVNNNVTEDSDIRVFTYGDSGSLVERYDNYTLCGYSSPVKIIAEPNGSGWISPSVTGQEYGEFRLTISSDTKITIFSEKPNMYIDTIEFIGESIEELQLESEEGKQKNLTWSDTKGEFPTHVTFSCKQGDIETIKIRTRNVQSAIIDNNGSTTIDDGKVYNYGFNYNDYNVPNVLRGVSDFNFAEKYPLRYYKDGENLSTIDYSGNDRISLKGYNIVYGSAIISFKSEYNTDAYIDLTGDHPRLVLDPNMEFDVLVKSVQSGLAQDYRLSTIKFFGNGELTIAPWTDDIYKDEGNIKIVDYRNFDGVNYTVTLRVLGTISAVFDRIEVRHTGICGLPPYANISRTYTNYYILEELERGGNPVYVTKLDNLNIIVPKPKVYEFVYYGLAPNLTKGTVKLMCDDYPEKPIMEGHFEVYQLSKWDLINTPTLEDDDPDHYYAIKFVPDYRDITYHRAIETSKHFVYEVDQDAFGDFHFFEYLLNYENPEFVKAEECKSNPAFSFEVNLN